jgi:hypothetical protein
MKYLEFTHEFIGNFRRKDSLTFDSKLHKTIELTQSDNQHAIYMTVMKLLKNQYLKDWS